jgi:CRP/FNR family transcriptional regulator
VSCIPITAGDLAMFDIDITAPLQPTLRRPELSPAKSTKPACPGCPVRSIGICGSFCGSGDNDLIGSLSRHVTYQSRSALMEEGGLAQHAFNLISGTVILSKALPDGRRQVLGFAVAGDFLGLTMRDTNAMTAVALGPVEVCRMQRPHLRDLARQSAKFMGQLHDMMASELESAHDHMMLLGRRGVEEKLACFLLSLRQRIARQQPISPRVDLPMTRLDIADYLGVTLETVSRTLSKMARNRLIVIVPDGVRLLDIDALERMASLKVL